VLAEPKLSSSPLTGKILKEFSVQKINVLITLGLIIISSLSASANCVIYFGDSGNEEIAKYSDDGKLMYKVMEDLETSLHREIGTLDGDRFFKFQSYSPLVFLSNSGSAVRGNEVDQILVARLNKSGKVVVGPGFSDVPLAHGKGKQCTRNELLLGTAALIAEGLLKDRRGFDPH
jgi:hypothetical protein